MDCNKDESVPAAPVTARRQQLDIEFKLRNSPWTEIVASSKLAQFLEHAVAAAILFAFLANAITEWLDNGLTSHVFLPNNLAFLAYLFENWLTGVIVWLQMMAFALAFYVLVRLLCHHNHCNWLLLGHIAFQGVFLTSTYDILFRNPVLGPAVAMAIALEQMRLLAKMHAFAREKSKTTKANHSDDDLFPSFLWYLYFLFAPVLVYRDSYPRSPVRHWRHVFAHFAEFFVCCACFYCLFDRFWLADYYANYVLAKKPVTLATMVKTFVNGILPGMAAYFLFFYAFWEKWLNGWAELLRFGDRQFYRDWWTASNPAEYLRRWNSVVRNWLHVYVYKEYFDLTSTHRRFLPTMLVFGVSIAFHEFVMIALLRFYLPFFLITLTLGGLTLGLTPYQPPSERRLDAFSVLLNNIVGCCHMFAFHLFEIAARRVCNNNAEQALEQQQVPHFWTCFSNNEEDGQ